MTHPERAVADTKEFGRIVIARADGQVSTTLEFDDSTVVTIDRLGPRARERVPIGSRNAKHLTASINDRPLVLTPGGGRFYYRWTYRAVAEVEEKIWRLLPTDLYSSTVTVGYRLPETPDRGPVEDEHVLGEFRLRSNKQIDVAWALPFTARDTRAVAQPDAEDALVAYALVAAFGTGGVSLWDLAHMILPI